MPMLSCNHSKGIKRKIAWPNGPSTPSPSEKPGFQDSAVARKKAHFGVCTCENVSENSCHHIAFFVRILVLGDPTLRVTNVDAEFTRSMLPPGMPGMI